MPGLWDYWAAAQGQQGLSTSEPRDDSDTMRLFTGLTKELARWSQSKEKGIATQRIASLKAAIAQSTASKRLIGTYEQSRSAENRERIKSLTSMRNQLTKSWADYSKSMADTYSPILAGMSATGSDEAAWRSFIGSFKDDPARFDTQNPAFANTFKSANDKHGRYVVMDSKGNIQYDTVGGVKVVRLSAAAKSLTGDTQNKLREYAKQYQSVREGNQQWLNQLEQAEDTIDAGIKEMGKNPTGKPTQTENEAFERALNAAKTIDRASNAHFGINKEQAAKDLEFLKSEDAEYQDLKSAWGDIRDQLNLSKGAASDEEMMKKIVADPYYQQYAKDRGMHIGYVDSEGDYVAGGDDRRMLIRHARESKRKPGDYGLFRGRATEELIQLVDKNGAVVDRGYRMPVHASDRRGSVRMMTPAGIKVFTDKQIEELGGKFQVLSAPTPKPEPGFIGAARAQARTGEDISALEMRRQISATKPAELVTETEYATRQGPQGETIYLDKVGYADALSAGYGKAAQAVRVGGKTYYRTPEGDVYRSEQGRGAQSGAMVTAPLEPGQKDLRERILAEKDFRVFTKADGKLLMAGDLESGSVDIPGLIKINPAAKPGEKGAPSAEARTQVLRTVGVTLTEEARPVVTGTEVDRGGVTFLEDTTIPSQPSTVPPKPKAKRERPEQDDDELLDIDFQEEDPEEPEDLDIRQEGALRDYQTKSKVYHEDYKKYLLAKAKLDQTPKEKQRPRAVERVERLEAAADASLAEVEVAYAGIPNKALPWDSAKTNLQQVVRGAINRETPGVLDLAPKPAPTPAPVTEGEGDKDDQPKAGYKEPVGNTEFDGTKAAYRDAYTAFEAHRTSPRPTSVEENDAWDAKLETLRKAKFEADKQLQDLIKQHNPDIKDEKELRLYINSVQDSIPPATPPVEKTLLQQAEEEVKKPGLFKRVRERLRGKDKSKAPGVVSEDVVAGVRRKRGTPAKPPGGQLPSGSTAQSTKEVQAALKALEDKKLKEEADRAAAQSAGVLGALEGAGEETGVLTSSGADPLKAWVAEQKRQKKLKEQQGGK